MKNEKIVNYEVLLKHSVQTHNGDKKCLKEVIRPSKMEELHPYGEGVSLLDIDAKEDLRGQFNGLGRINKFLKLSKLLYGDLFSDDKESQESREKFGKYLLAGLNLFKKASHGYFEEKTGFIEFEKKIREKFIDKIPNSNEIKSLFFAGNKNSIFSSEDEMIWIRVILQSSLPETYRAEDKDSWDNLSEVQEDLTKIINSLITKDKKILGVPEAEVIEVLGQEKSVLRINQKYITKPGLDKTKIPDSVRGRLVLKVKEGDDKKEVLGHVAEKISKKISIRKYRAENVHLEDPGDGSRTEFKVEGLIKNKTFEVSIFDNEAYELDEKYGLYAHEIYDFIKGDAIYLSRMGMLKKGYLEKRVAALGKLESWKSIPAKSYEKISRDFKEVIRRKKGVEKITITKEVNGKKETEKFYTISESTARAIIRERLRRIGFRFDIGKNRYFLIDQALNKTSLTVKAIEVYELQRIAKEIFKVVNKNISKKLCIDENTAMGIILGNTYKVRKEVFEIIKKELGLDFKKD